MHCPFCQHSDNRVLESRSAEAGRSIRRRRECLRCQQRFTTYERIEYIPMTVIKQNGDREPFERDKILNGVLRASEKTNLSRIVLDSIVDEVESSLQQQASREVTSATIGDLVLGYLRPHSEVAYLRFASIHKRFQDVQDFAKALNYLQHKDAAEAEAATKTVAIAST
ncbi:MAG: transcriptional regulator NrdR [Cyanobacteria bacterium P01_H01_bin.119]